jgi:hypothetical protein
MAKTGKAAKDIFTPTDRPTKDAPTPGPGRPTKSEDWSKVTVVLYDRQTLFLDRLALDIRANSGASVSRAEIIRALVDVLEDGGLDLTAVTSEADLKAAIAAGLSR